MHSIRFIWDDAKNLTNIKKHRVIFDDAIRTYYDPNRLDIFDEVHSTPEETRWIYLGLANETVLFVVETEASKDEIRIISARKALKHEQEEYYGNGN